MRSGVREKGERKEGRCRSRIGRKKRGGRAPTTAKGTLGRSHFLELGKGKGEKGVFYTYQEKRKKRGEAIPFSLTIHG